MANMEVLIAILTSAVVASIVSFLLRYIFEGRQEHRYEKEIANLKHNHDIQIERIKSDAAIHVDMQREITERRLKSYPHIVELVYRTRNMARELSSINHVSALSDEFRARTNELEDCLYQFRIDLERDNLFAPIHAYKNLLKSFGLTVRDITLQQPQDVDSDQRRMTIERLLSLYDNIESAHVPIIERLSHSASTPELAQSPHGE